MISNSHEHVQQVWDPIGNILKNIPSSQLLYERLLIMYLRVRSNSISALVSPVFDRKTYRSVSLHLSPDLANSVIDDIELGSLGSVAKDSLDSGLLLVIHG